MKCAYCGTTTPLPLQTDPVTKGVLNNRNLPGFVGFNTTLAMEICTPPIAQSWGVGSGGLVTLYAAQ